MTSNGLYEYTNVYELYYRRRLRNVYVVRVDFIKELNEFFTDVSLKERELIYHILSGDMFQTKPELLLKIIEHFYKTDNKFQLLVGRLLYFPDDRFLENSIYIAIVKTLYADFLKKKEKRLSSTIVKRHICDSHMYSYIAVDKDVSKEELRSYIGDFEEVSLC